MIVRVSYGVPHNDQGLDGCTEQEVEQVAEEYARLLEEWCRETWPGVEVDWHYYYSVGVESYGDRFHAFANGEPGENLGEEEQAEQSFDDAASELWGKAIENALAV